LSALTAPLRAARRAPVIAFAVAAAFATQPAPATPRRSGRPRLHPRAGPRLRVPQQPRGRAAASRIAWLANDRGRRNVWVAEAPRWEPRQLTAWDDRRRPRPVRTAVPARRPAPHLPARPRHEPGRRSREPDQRRGRRNARPPGWWTCAAARRAALPAPSTPSSHRRATASRGCRAATPCCSTWTRRHRLQPTAAVAEPYPPLHRALVAVRAAVVAGRHAHRLRQRARRPRHHRRRRCRHPHAHVAHEQRGPRRHAALVARRLAHRIPPHLTGVPGYSVWSVDARGITRDRARAVALARGAHGGGRIVAYPVPSPAATTSCTATAGSSCPASGQAGTGSTPSPPEAARPGS
jgi:hypothetical protein